MKDPASKDRLLLLLSFVLFLLALVPVLFTGLYSDDAMNFFLRDVAGGQQRSVWALSLPFIKYWMGLGRFTPLNLVWLEFAFKYFTTVTGYKLFVYVMNVLAAGMFMLYLRQLNTGIKSALWLFFFCALIQFRIQYHDAFTSLNGLYQALAILIFLTAWLYARYAKTGNIYWLVPALVIAAVTILFGEIGLLVMVLLPLTGLVLRVSVKRIVISMVPFVALTLVYLAYVAYLRSQVDPANSYAGLSSNVSPAAMSALIIRQVFAALPLSNLYNQANIPTLLAHQLTLMPIALLAIGLLAAGGLFIVRQAKTPTDESGRPFNWWLLALWLAIIIMPAVIMSPSVKYQREVRMGLGYLPVFIQSMGTAALLAYLFTRLWQHTRWKVVGIALLGFALCSTLLSLLFNNALLRVQNVVMAYPAMDLHQAAKQNLLSDCQNGSAIVISHAPLWKAGWLYRDIFGRITGKDFMVYDAGDWQELGAANSWPACYRIDCLADSVFSLRLYSFDCSGADTTARLLQQRNYPTGIVLTAEERIILWR